MNNLDQMAQDPYAEQLLKQQQQQQLIESLRGIQNFQPQQQLANGFPVAQSPGGGWAKILGAVGGGLAQNQQDASTLAMIRELRGKEQAARAQFNAPVTTPEQTIPGAELQGPPQQMASGGMQGPGSAPDTVIPATSRPANNAELMARMSQASPDTMFGKNLQDMADKAKIGRLFAGPMKLGVDDRLVDPNTGADLVGGASGERFSTQNEKLIKEMKPSIDSLTKALQAKHQGKSDVEAMALLEPADKYKESGTPGIFTASSEGGLGYFTKGPNGEMTPISSADVNKAGLEYKKAGATQVSMANVGPKVEEARRIEGAKSINTAMFESQKKAEEANNTLQTTNQIRQALKSGAFTGSGADAKKAAFKILNAVVPGGVEESKVANTEYLDSLFTSNLKQFKTIFGPQISNADIKNMVKGSGGIETTAPGLLLMLNQQENMANKDLTNHATLTNAYRKYQQDGDVAGFLANTGQHVNQAAPQTATPQRRASDGTQVMRFDAQGNPL